MVVHTRNPTALRRQRQEEIKFGASLGYMLRPYPPKKNQNQSTKQKTESSVLGLDVTISVSAIER
jgi:hypothetical protein